MTVFYESSYTFINSDHPLNPRKSIVLDENFHNDLERIEAVMVKHQLQAY